MQQINILLTGVAGFIGAHLAQRPLAENKDVQIIGIDNLNDYYDISLKAPPCKKVVLKNKKKI